MTEEERATFLVACEEAERMAREQDVVLCMECHKKTFTESPDDAIWLMEKIHSPYFRMYWQPFQWQSETENEENARRIAPYGEHIHVFNWKGDAKLPLARAIEEWQRYLRHFSLPRTLLLEFMPNGTLEELAEETAALRLIIEKE